MCRSRPCAGAHLEHRPRPVQVDRLDPRRPCTPRTGRPRHVEQRRVERRAVEPDRLPPSAVRQAERRSRRASRRASPGWAGRPRASVASSSPTRRSAATAAGDANTPPARQRHAGARSNRTTSWPARASSDATTAPAGPPPTIATSGSVTGRPAAGEPSVGCRDRDHRVALAERGRPAIDRLQPGPAQQPLDLRRASTPAGRTAANRHACSGSG